MIYLLHHDNHLQYLSLIKKVKYLSNANLGMIAEISRMELANTSILMPPQTIAKKINHKTNQKNP